jgi:hypothetical protein
MTIYDLRQKKTSQEAISKNLREAAGTCFDSFKGGGEAVAPPLKKALGETAVRLRRSRSAGLFHGQTTARASTWAGFPRLSCLQRADLCNTHQQYHTNPPTHPKKIQKKENIGDWRAACGCLSPARITVPDLRQNRDHRDMFPEKAISPA